MADNTIGGGGTINKGVYTGRQGESQIAGSDLKMFNAGTIDTVTTRRPFTPQEVKPYVSKVADVKPDTAQIPRGQTTETQIQHVPVVVNPPKPPAPAQPRTDYGLGDLFASIFGEVLKGLVSGGGPTPANQPSDQVDDWLGLDKPADTTEDTSGKTEVTDTPDEPAKVDPPKDEPAKVDPPADEPAKVDPPKDEPAKVDPPADEPPKDDPPAEREKLGKKTKFASVADPHVTTSDGLKFDNDQTGDFVLAKSDKGNLEIQTHQDEIPGDDGVWQTNAAIKTDGDLVKYDAASNTVNINGQDVPFKAGKSIDLPGGGKVTMSDDKLASGTSFHRLQVHTKEGDDVYMLDFKRKGGGSYLDIVGNMSPNREKGEISGVSGTIDGDGKAANDMVSRDGKVTSDRESFIDSWRVGDKESIL